MFWYSKQEICIKWGNETSSCFIIFNGVRQGGILSPVLFSIYMDDLSVLLSRSGIGCHIDDLCINHVFYADDLCLMAPCAIALQELINLCYEYSIRIDMNFNALKSYGIAFTPKLYKLTLPSLHISSLPISYTDSIKYLGYMFSSNNSDDNEMIRQMRLLYCRSNRLFRMFNKCSKHVLIELCRHVDMCGVEGKRRLCDLNVTSSSPALATRHIRIVLLVNSPNKLNLLSWLLIYLCNK